MSLRGSLFFAGVTALSLAQAACSGDHSGLGTTDGATSTGSGGASSSGATTGAGGEASTSTASGKTTTSSSSGTGGSGGSEPVGPSTLTVVNGVNDADAIRLCFLDYPDASNSGAMPWPPEDEGLAFAAGRVIVPPESVIPDAVDVRIMVVAGDLTQAAGATCAEIVAMAGADAGAPVVVADLPVLPASAFTSGKNLLLVPMGCVGGPTHTDPLEKLACGSTYSVTTPSVSLTALGMSQVVDAAHVGLQVVHAAPAMLAQDFRLTPGFDGAIESKVANGLTMGAIGPTTPFFGLASTDIGSATQAKLNTYFPNDSFATSATLLSTIFATSDLTAPDIDNGETFVFVAVGAYPGIPGGAWWHPLTYTIVRASP